MKENSIFYEEGSKAVLLFHSYSGTPNIFFSLANALRKKGYTVYVPVLSGHENNDLDEVFENSFDEWVKDQEAAVKFLKDKGYKNISVFGLSIGGILAIRSLINHPDLNSAGTLCSPMVNNPSHFNIKNEFLEYYLKVKKEEGLTSSEIDKLKITAEEKLEDFIKSMRAVLDSLAPYYSSIEQPIFVAQGGEDMVINPEIASNFTQLLKKSIFVDFYYDKKAGHLITVGEDGIHLNDRFIQFLYQVT